MGSQSWNCQAELDIEDEAFLFEEANLRAENFLWTHKVEAERSPDFIYLRVL